MLEKMSQNCTFIYNIELDSIWGAISILSNERSHNICAEIYGVQAIEYWHHKYAYLYEMFSQLEKSYKVNLMDFLLDIPLDNFSISQYKEYLLSLAPETFIWRMLNLDMCNTADIEVLRNSLTSDAAIEEVYHWISDSCPSLLVLSAFIRQCDRFIQDFFSLAEEMVSVKLENAINQRQNELNEMYHTISDGLNEMDPNSMTEQLMGKKVHNQGPFTKFIFCPSYFLPYKVCRFFHIQGESKRQILFLALHPTHHNRKDIIKALKAIADPTRYQILTVLSQEGPMRGMDIARKVSVATYTISHHMEQMKECGLITEEPVKNSKYYGLSKQNVEALLDEIAKEFELK